MVVAYSFGVLSPAWATIYFKDLCFSSIFKAQLWSSSNLPHDNIDCWMLFECLQAVEYNLMWLDSLASIEYLENTWDKFCGVGADYNTCVLELFLPYVNYLLTLLLDATWPSCGTWLCKDNIVDWLAVIILNKVGDMMYYPFSFESTKFICSF